jgi:hypothetical protein
MAIHLASKSGFTMVCSEPCARRREASAASGGRQLRELLQLKANYAKDKALESAGAIAAEELEDLDRLSRLVRICDEAQPKPRRRHLPIIMLFLATLMVGSLMLFTGQGHPKTVKQLAGACRAILNGEITTASGNETPIIYPIFVSDEPTLETAFMNGYFNDEFQKETEMDDSRVRPLTVMTIDELEQLLTHSSDGDIQLEELLQSRFNRKAVQASSVGQALYDMLVSKGVPVKQNQVLKLKYDEFGNIMHANFAKEEDVALGTAVDNPEAHKRQE